MMVKIYDSETVIEIARKIYNDFDVMSSCRVSGFVLDEALSRLIPKGEIIMAQIKKMYEDEYVDINKGKIYRKYKYKDNSVGGPIAHKIFTWELRIVDDEPRYTIWRYQ